MNRPPVLDEAHDILLTMLADTSRHVDILSPDLEPLLLDDEAVASAITAIARRGRNTRIRLIVADIRPVIESGHQLLALSRRLSTAISVRVLTEHSEWNRETLVICDGLQGLYLKLDEHRWRHLNKAPDAARESERFDRLWNAGEVSPELRQF